MAMAFYFAFGALFVEKKAGVQPRNVGPLMTLGQGIEIIFMLSLGWFLKTLGMNVVLSLGVAAWAIRFGLFAKGSPLPLVILGIALHGYLLRFLLCGRIHLRRCTGTCRDTGNAQTLYGMLVYGFGMYLGSVSSGWLNQWAREKKR